MHYEYALEKLKMQLEFLIKQYAIKNNYNPVEHMKSRLKTMESIKKKLDKRGYEITEENIKNHVHDVVGIRIVCCFLSDLYDVVNLIKNFKQLTVVSEKDYIVNPKKSGYTSYHLIVTMPICLNDKIENIEAEIQIRTVAMDFWASLEHKIQYKFTSELPEEVSCELFNCALDIQSLDHKMLELNKIVNKYEKD